MWRTTMERELQGSFPLAFWWWGGWETQLHLWSPSARIGVESQWIPSAGLLSTHLFIRAAARYSVSRWVSDVPSTRTFPPASPRGTSPSQSLEQEQGRIPSSFILCDWDLESTEWSAGSKRAGGRQMLKIASREIGRCQRGHFGNGESTKGLEGDMLSDMNFLALCWRHFRVRGKTGKNFLADEATYKWTWL